MSVLVAVLRFVPLLAFAGAMLRVPGHRRRATSRARPHGRRRAPVVVNFAAFGAYVPSLLAFSGSSAGSAALMLAMSGALLAGVGAALVVRSRAELGAAWSFVPKADQGTGLVTTGPYRFVRHPIYLGLALLAMGEALAFASWPALTIVVSAVIPTLVWRARSEERLLSCTFGDRYTVYRQRTRMMRNSDARFKPAREWTMLADSAVATRLPVQDLARARRFYSEKLGLEPSEERPGGLLYCCRSGSFALFESAGAPSGSHTQMGWEVADIEATVVALRSRGVVFEEYGLPGLTTVNGIAAIEGNYPSKGVGERAAWFRDSEGNLLGLGQAVPVMSS